MFKNKLNTIKNEDGMSKIFKFGFIVLAAQILSGPAFADISLPGEFIPSGSLQEVPVIFSEGKPAELKAIVSTVATANGSLEYRVKIVGVGFFDPCLPPAGDSGLSFARLGPFQSSTLSLFVGYMPVRKCMSAVTMRKPVRIVMPSSDVSSGFRLSVKPEHVIVNGFEAQMEYL